ncbi:MAG: septum formation initiator [Prevotella sp.]
MDNNDEYNSQYERDDQKLKELRRNPRAITKIARENYMMKADDEDIFVLSDDEKQETSKNETAE